MTSPRRSLFLAALLIAISAAAPLDAAAKGKDPAQAITSDIICPCSCGEVLSGCTCDTGKSMQAFVETSLKEGKSKDQIVGALVARYGEVIRGAPKAQGFNLIVWIAPFAVTLVGFAIAFIILRRWARRGPALAGGAGGLDGAGHPTTEDSLESLRARAEAELRRMRG